MDQLQLDQIGSSINERKKNDLFQTLDFMEAKNFIKKCANKLKFTSQ